MLTFKHAKTEASYFSSINKSSMDCWAVLHKVIQTRSLSSFICSKIGHCILVTVTATEMVGKLKEGSLSNVFWCPQSSFTFSRLGFGHMVKVLCRGTCNCNPVHTFRGVWNELWWTAGSLGHIWSLLLLENSFSSWNKPSLLHSQNPCQVLCASKEAPCVSDQSQALANHTGRIPVL